VSASKSAPPRSRLWVYARTGATLLVWLGFLMLAYFINVNGRYGGGDFIVYVEAGAAVRAGGQVYDLPGDGQSYLYPPLLAIAFAPFATLPFAMLSVGWLALQAALLFGVTALVSQTMSPARRVWLWLSVPLFAGVFEALIVGQITIVLMTLFAGAWWAYRSQRYTLVGVLLAAATWIKIYPVLMIVWFIWRRDWRVVAAAFVAGVMLLAFQIAAGGLDLFADSLAVIFSLNASGQDWMTANSSSVTAFTGRLFGEYPRVVPLLVDPALQALSRAALTIGLLGGAVWFTRPTRAVTKSDAPFDLGFSLMILTALLISPTLWVSGMPPLLLYIWLVWRHLPQKTGLTIMHWLLLGVFITIALFFLFILGYSGDPALNGLQLSYGFYALVVLWIMHVVLLQKL